MLRKEIYEIRANNGTYYKVNRNMSKQGRKSYANDMEYARQMAKIQQSSVLAQYPMQLGNYTYIAKSPYSLYALLSNINGMYSTQLVNKSIKINLHFGKGTQIITFNKQVPSAIYTDILSTKYYNILGYPATSIKVDRYFNYVIDIDMTDNIHNKILVNASSNKLNVL